MAWYCEDCGGRLNWPRKLGGCPNSKRACANNAYEFPLPNRYMVLDSTPDVPEQVDLDNRMAYFNAKRAKPL